MVRDLNFDIEIVVVPTVREPDGLAMSSRNSYLTPDERQQAVVLYKALRHAEQLIKDGERDARKVKRAMRRIIQNSSSGRIDYIEIVDTDYLKPIQLIKMKYLLRWQFILVKRG